MGRERTVGKEVRRDGEGGGRVDGRERDGREVTEEMGGMGRERRQSEGEERGK